MDALRDELLGKLDNKIAFTIPVFGGILCRNRWW